MSAAFNGKLFSGGGCLAFTKLERSRNRNHRKIKT